MNARSARAATAAGLCCLLSMEAAVSAQSQPAAPGPSATAAAAPAPVPEEADLAAKKKEAQSAFEKGLSHFAKEEWDAALADFVLSRAAYPTRSATKNAALCLQKLRRLDETLDMFEELLKFSNLPDDDRKTTESAIAELRQSLGTLQIELAERGASIVVDGRYRGTFPLPGPLRVGAGSHEVRAFKEGFDPFGATAEVSAGQATTVTLRSLSTAGRLKVIEERGQVLDVVVDGSVVGKTPWEGPLSPGEHIVTLSGSVNLDALGVYAASDAGTDAAKPAAKMGLVQLGTQPVSVAIKVRELTKLTLTAEVLDTSLRVEPTPGGASVAIDSVVVGRGAWEGRLRVGEHKVEVMADGFLPALRRVELEPRKRQVLAIELERDGNTAEARTRKNTWMSIAYTVGAVGLATSVVTSTLALSKIEHLKSVCPDDLCPPAQRGNLGEVRTLEAAATAGVVLAGVGAAAGTIILFATRPGAGKPGGVASLWQAHLRAGVGLGRFELKGSF